MFGTANLGKGPTHRLRNPRAITTEYGATTSLVLQVDLQQAAMSRLRISSMSLSQIEARRRAMAAFNAHNSTFTRSSTSRTSVSKTFGRHEVWSKLHAKVLPAVTGNISKRKPV